MPYECMSIAADWLPVLVAKLRTAEIIGCCPLLNGSLWLVQISLPGTEARARKPEEVEPFETLKVMIKGCLRVDPQQRIKAATMAKTLFVAADKAGWL